jgi:endonuclease VIII
MAEGDTIHGTARRLERALGGRLLLDVAVPNPASPLRRQAPRVDSLHGGFLERAEARGKHLLLHFDTGLTLHSHLGMRGSWRIEQRGARWGRPRHGAWVVLSTAVAEAAQFGGTRLALRAETELRSDPRIRWLGADLLAPDFEATTGVAALRALDQRRTVGEALLDQRTVAGIGNVYKSEGCFAASVSPWSALAEIPDGDLERLIDELRSLMAGGLRVGTSTAADLPPSWATVPALWGADPLSRAGRREPRHLLVSQLPALVPGERAAGPYVASGAG